MNLHGLPSDVGLLGVDMGLFVAEAGVHEEEDVGPQEVEVVVMVEADAEVANVHAVSSIPILFLRRLLALK